MNFVLVSANERGLSPGFDEDLSSLLSRQGFRVKKKVPLQSNQVHRQELTSAQDLNRPQLKKDLLSLSDAHETDLALIEEEVFLTPKKLLIFDMDSTLIQHEVIDEMAVAFGIGDQVKMITKRAMNGELNFDQSLAERVALLKGLPREALDVIGSNLKLMPGAEQLIRVAKKSGAHTVIASGGFSFFAEKIRARLGMDEAYSNELDWDGTKLSGKVNGVVVNAQYKAELVTKLAHHHKLDLSEVVTVGDGANDIPMLLRAGLGFAFHAKDKVRREANHQLHHGPLNTLLYFMNIPGEHFA